VLSSPLPRPPQGPKALLLLLAAAASPSVAQAKRVALVIGMSDYQHLSSLINPVPGRSPPSSSRTASRSRNITISIAPISWMRSRNSSVAEVALVYSAGHGMEVDGKNVLALRCVIAGAQQIVLLDACRNNPFPQCARDKFGLWLPRLSLVGKADRTLLIANATLSGNLAADGDPGAHSPFASALIKNFNEHPRLYFGDLLNMTAADVRVASRGAQIPEITARGGSPRICLDVEGSPRSTSSRCWLTS